MSDNTKIVYAALRRMTDDRDAIKQAFLSWHGKFASSDLDVFAFVDHIEGYLGISTAEKKVLMMSMYAASSRAPDSLNDVPEYIMGSGITEADDRSAIERVTVTVKPKPKSPVISLAEIYFNRMAAGVQRLGNKYKVELVAILADEALPGASKALAIALRNFDGTAINLPKGMTEQECKSLCHEMYMLVCDLIGPTLTDDLSYTAVNFMLDASEASRYDPKNLI